jgi:PAT family beta-lactamase induction signal transducer AmpG
MENSTELGNSYGSWKEALSVYSRPRVMAMALLGFSAGLPFLLVFSTLTAWLTDSGVTRSAIGFFAWVGLTYSIKVFWAPIVDRIKLPGLNRALGQRRSWIFLGQAGITVGLVSMALTDPTQSLIFIAISALLVAFSSATQDIAIDAYRIEAEEDQYQGAMSASYIFGYRIALLVAGAGALYLAEYFDWRTSYLVMGALMSIGIATVLLVQEPDRTAKTDSAITEQRVVDYLLRNQHKLAWVRDLEAWFIGAVVCPFVDFFERNGRFALVILLFIACFRLSDIAMGIMANPFYLDLGFSKSEIANIAKLFGFVMTIAGSVVCGLMVVRFGIFRPLLAGAIAVASTNLLFILLAIVGPRVEWLAIVISADNLSGGFAATAFVAYLSSLTNRSYTATQYALFSSLMTLPGKFISGFSGVIVDSYGYISFFLFAALIGVPAIALVLVLIKHHRTLSARADPTGHQ